jgi:phospholipid/cholesterol/gamma-HCH transport system substrate-binding protein
VGLSVSNHVYANGYAVGIVREINYDYKNTDRVVVAVELDEDMRVPVGTVAELETSLMGSIKMNLILGKNPLEVVEKGDTIQGDLHKGAMDEAAKFIPVVAEMLPKLDSILTNVNNLTGNPALVQILSNTAQISSELNATSRQLNVMMQQDIPSLLTHLNATSQNLQKLSGNLAAVDVQKTMKEVDETVVQMQQFSNNLNNISQSLNTKLNSTDNSLGLLLNSRNFYDNLNNTVQHTDSLVTDLKNHPKRYVHFSVFGKKDK